MPIILFCLLLHTRRCTARLAKSIYSVKSEGFAVITSTLPSSGIDRELLKTHAEIALDQEQSVSSFTVIENGQMLIDQIQSRSSAGVLRYCF